MTIENLVPGQKAQPKTSFGDGPNSTGTPRVVGRTTNRTQGNNVVTSLGSIRSQRATEARSMARSSGPGYAYDRNGQRVKYSGFVRRGDDTYGFRTPQAHARANRKVDDRNHRVAAIRAKAERDGIDVDTGGANSLDFVQKKEASFGQSVILEAGTKGLEYDEKIIGKLIAKGVRGIGKFLRGGARAARDPNSITRTQGRIAARAASAPVRHPVKTAKGIAGGGALAVGGATAFGVRHAFSDVQPHSETDFRRRQGQ